MVPNIGRFNANDILMGVREKHGLTSRADDDLRANKFALLEFRRVSLLSLPKARKYTSAQHTKTTNYGTDSGRKKERLFERNFIILYDGRLRDIATVEVRK
ncbi:hypothetical protein V1478_000442 [Vespula squamosa]|uniref:Uncharacterized protein n=1 Tax=Vespula squamosa TaxID=30214 RepID=A0ABD2C5I5_VESSQ